MQAAPPAFRPAANSPRKPKPFFAGRPAIKRLSGCRVELLRGQRVEERGVERELIVASLVAHDRIDVRIVAIEILARDHELRPTVGQVPQ